MPDPTLWEKVVVLIQAAFFKGHLAEEFTWQTAILIPNGNGRSRDIGLIEVLWKP